MEVSPELDRCTVCGHSRTFHNLRGSQCTECHCVEFQGPPLPGGVNAPQHLGGPDDDHYAHLPVQPLVLTEQMSEVWPRAVVYHLGEAMAAVLRVGSKGQDVRDLRKAAWLLERAANKLEGELAPSRRTPVVNWKRYPEDEKKT